MQLPTQLPAAAAPTLLARLMHAIVLISIIMVTITGLVVTSVLLGRIGSLTYEETTTTATTPPMSFSTITTTLTSLPGESTTVAELNDILELSENVIFTQKSTPKNKPQKARTSVKHLNPHPIKQVGDHKTAKVKQVTTTKKMAFKRAHNRNISSAKANHTSTPLFKQRTLWLEVL